jgi:hypothetical protein
MKENHGIAFMEQHGPCQKKLYTVTSAVAPILGNRVENITNIIIIQNILYVYLQNINHTVLIIYVLCTPSRQSGRMDIFPFALIITAHRIPN